MSVSIQAAPRRTGATLRWRPHWLDLLPGLGLTFGLAAVAYGLTRLPYIGTFSPLIVSIMLGMLFHNVVRTPAACVPGVKFSLRRILRFAIILLGLQLSIAEALSVGGAGLLVIVATLVATLGFTIWLGRRLGVDPKLSQLIATGTAICGASAVIAANTVTEGTDEDVAYAVACVTVFGSVAMFAYPLLPAVLHLDPHAYGLWSGSSIHEIAQVVAAAFQDGKQAGEYATIAKLSRVMMLAPTVMVLGLMAARRARDHGQVHGRARPPLPWFVLGFIALAGVNSVVTMPTEARSAVVLLTTFLLSMALAAMGLETDIAKLKAKGIKPFILGLSAFVFIAGFSLMLVKMTT